MTAADQAFTLVVCYRFGLRTSEVIGLNREDWIDAGRANLVAVRSNRARPLKTSASRRIVPLLEPITEVEQSVMTRVLDDWQRRDGTNARTPLLTGVRKETIASVKAGVGAALLDVLKGVTRNPGTTVHMLRHSFAMRTTARLMNLNLEPGTPPDAEASDALRMAVLGTHHLDRRTLWAVARLLGHAAPTCTLLSYINCLHLWLPVLEQPAGRSTESGTQILTTQYMNLDRYPRLNDYLENLPVRVQTDADALTHGDKFLRGLEFLRFMVVGQTEDEAQKNAKLPNGFGRVIGAALARVGDRLAGSQKRYAGFKLLGNVRPTRFRELIDRATAAPADARDDGERVDDWLYTIGSSRQVLAYQAAHFSAIAAFLKASGLTSQDVALVHEKSVHQDLLTFAARASLTACLTAIDQVPIGKGKAARAFQLDVPRVGPRGTVEKERIAMIPRFGGAVSDTHELATLWLMWNLSAM